MALLGCLPSVILPGKSSQDISGQVVSPWCMATHSFFSETYLITAILFRVASQFANEAGKVAVQGGLVSLIRLFPPSRKQSRPGPGPPTLACQKLSWPSNPSNDRPWLLERFQNDCRRRLGLHAQRASQRAWTVRAAIRVQHMKRDKASEAEGTAVDGRAKEEGGQLDGGRNERKGCRASDRLTRPKVTARAVRG